MTHPYLDHDGPLAIAHRGGTTVAPENTMAAFAHAVELGYTYLETDVHLTADGELIAFHDADLARTCGVDRSIAELTAADIAAVRVGGTEPIPRLADLFDAFPDARFNIDAKADAAVEPLAEFVARHRAIERVCLASFSLRRVRRLRRLLGTRLLTGMSSPEIAALKVTGRRLPVDRSSPVAAQVPPANGRVTVVDERFVRRCHAASIPVHVWTINESDEMHRLLDLGVDGVMTDDPELLAAVYVERGVWSR